jgi:hypothetical protein
MREDDIITIIYVLNMSSYSFPCGICNSEIASVGCICCKDLLLIGSRCLTYHVQQCGTMHYVIRLSLASDLISD